MLRDTSRVSYGRWIGATLTRMGLLGLVAGFVFASAGGNLPERPRPRWADLPAVWAQYFQLADIVFPRSPISEAPLEFVLTLRFLPTFGRDSQIVISRKPRDGYLVTYYRLREPGKSLSEQLTVITAESKIEDPVEIAKRVKVNIQTVDLPPSVISKQVGDISKIELSPVEELDAGFVHPDATTYQFWLQRVGDPSGFYFCLKGDVYGQKHKPHALVRWMKETKTLVDQYAEAD